VRIKNCRSCNSSRLHVVLDLGEHPISNGLLMTPAQMRGEKRYSLQLALCEACALLQVTETIPPKVLYQQDYPYYSSSSPALLEHAAKVARHLIAERQLNPQSFVVEIASNDGYLLRNFVQEGIPCLGIDPASGPVKESLRLGVPALKDFFSLRLARRLAARGQLADLIIGNNVIAHVDAINDFVSGVATLLKPDGVAVFEFAYAVDMIERREFDTIYHEHLFYHTLHGISPLLARHGLTIVDAEKLPIHGGSLRIFAAREGAPSERLTALVEREAALGVSHRAWYQDFSRRVTELREALVSLLRSEKQGGGRIACYGAAAKGSTLVNFLDLGPGFFDYVVDANPHKHGKYMPGQHIPIVSPSRLQEDPPDLVLLLVWNFAGEVLRQQQAYRAAGGRFLVPVPEPVIIEADVSVEENRYAVGAPSSRTGDNNAIAAH
jgi:SAM-dependent methyltransferase